MHAVPRARPASGTGPSVISRIVHDERLVFVVLHRRDLCPALRRRDLETFDPYLDGD